MATKVNIRGITELQANLKFLAAQVPAHVGKALFQEAQIEKTESMRRTPVKDGHLRRSHTVSGPEIKVSGQGIDISATIGVGGAAAPYALYVHEDLTAFHKVGQAKFLESTLRESAPHLAKRIAARIKLNKLVK